MDTGFFQKQVNQTSRVSSLLAKYQGLRGELRRDYATLMRQRMVRLHDRYQAVTLEHLRSDICSFYRQRYQADGKP